MLLFWLNIFLISFFFITLILLPSSWFHCLRKQNELRKWKRRRSVIWPSHTNGWTKHNISRATIRSLQYRIPNSECQVLNNIEYDFGFIIYTTGTEWHSTTYRDLCSVHRMYFYLNFVFYFILFLFSFWILISLTGLLKSYTRSFTAFNLNRLVCGAWIWNLDIFDFVLR